MTDFESLLETLGQYQVAFIVVGGAAAIVHGSTRPTQDLDIVYQRSQTNLDRLVDALRDHNPYPRGVQSGLPFVWDRATLARGLNFTLVTSIGDITRCLCLSLSQLIRGKARPGAPQRSGKLVTAG